MNISPLKIKQTRKELGLTQLKSAKLVGVSRNTWQAWESGSRNMHEAYWLMFLKKINVIDNIPQPKKKFVEYSFNDIKKNSDSISKLTHKNITKKKHAFTFIDLFSGIGGIRQAFEQNDANCIFSSEIDTYAKFTYYTNFGEVPYGDITKIDVLDVPEHDILCAGFPCQPFSHIGKREGFSHPTQGTMFHEIVRIISAKKPQALFLENVPGLINHDNGKTLKTILNELKKLGYFCSYKVLDASEFGIPQKRRRFYLVGFLNNIFFDFPEPPMDTANIGDYLESNVKGYSISTHLQKSYLFKKNDGRPFLINKDTKGPIKTLVSSYHKIQRLTGTFVQDGETGLRLLTENECKAIMGFPHDFIIPVSRTQMYRQMGNSVVVPVIDQIAQKMISFLKKEEGLKIAI